MANTIKNTTQPQLGFGKYGILFVLVGAFFVLILAVVTATFFLSQKSNELVSELSLVAEQNELSHKLAEDVYDLHLHAQSVMQEKGNLAFVNISDLPQTALYRIENIKASSDKLTDIIHVFGAEGGGTVELDGDRSVTINGIDQETLKPFTQKMIATWGPYEGLVNSFVAESKRGVIDVETLQFMTDYNRAYGHSLQFESKNLSNGLSYYIDNNAQLISLVQVSGAGLAAILFIALVFGALGRLRKADAETASAQKETQDIMATVNTGLFLLDKDLNVGNQHSNALVNILGTNNLAGETLSSVLRNRISDKDLQTAEEFIDQLYNPRVKERLVDSLNPLHKVMMYDPNGGEPRYLDFKFSRVYEGKDIARILVNVNDVSEAVKLEQRLAKEKAENDRQIEMLSTILSVRSEIINDFILSTKHRIDKMNNILKNPGSSQFELEGKLKSLYREMHSLKGESSALKLHTFTKIASNAEDKLHALQNQDKLSGNDFLPLAVQLDELLNLSNTIQGLSERINASTMAMQLANEEEADDNEYSTIPTNGEVMTLVGGVEANAPVAQPPAVSVLAEYLVEFAKDIATRQNKLIEVDVSRMRDVAIPRGLSVIIKEICIQLLRNAIVHGIADTQTRVQNGKSPTGRVAVSFKDMSESDGSFMFVIEDDGKGIDYEVIRQKLIALGQPADKVNALDKAKLLNILFSSGFTTRQISDEDGGRGVGLDIVKERIKEYGGKINVQSEKGKFTRFVIKLPIPKS